MLVNAASFPGPALWQGLMLLLLPFYLWGVMSIDIRLPLRAAKKRFILWTAAYVVVGVALFFVILFR